MVNFPPSKNVFSKKVILIIFLAIFFLLSIFIPLAFIDNNQNYINTDTPSISLNYKNSDSVLGTFDTKYSFLDKSIPTLMYHYIREYSNTNDPIGINLSVSPQSFEKQMKQVVDNNYTTITFKDVQNYIENKTSLPSKPILLTFDDGYDNHYSQVFKILQKYNLKGSFAIITGFVEREGYLNWDQIKQMNNQGQEIVSHTVHHLDLAKQSAQTISYELSESKKILDSILNQNTNVLIYPSGKYNNLVINIAKQLGYIMARTTSYGTFFSSNNLMELPTIRMINSSNAPGGSESNVISPISSGSNVLPIKRHSIITGNIICPQYVNNENTTIQLKISDSLNDSNTLKMEVAQSSNFSGSSIEKYTTQKQIVLSSENGIKTIFVRFSNSDLDKSPIYSCDITLDKIKPVIQNLIIKNTNLQKVNVSWNTSKDTSDVLVYGISSNYTKKLSENSFAFSSTHNLDINNLLPCVTYHLKIKSVDKYLNANESVDTDFTTSGCIGLSKVLVKSNTDIPTNTVGSLKLENPEGSVNIEVPQHVSNANLNFQINKLEKNITINTIGIPPKLKTIGNNVYEFKAVDDNLNLVSVFMNPIKISFSYNKNDIENINMDSFNIYRWDSNTWTKLDNCENDLTRSILTCDTNHFSTFALFAQNLTLPHTILKGINKVTNNTDYSYFWIFPIVFLLGFTGSNLKKYIFKRH